MLVQKVCIVGQYEKYVFHVIGSMLNIVKGKVNTGFLRGSQKVKMLNCFSAFCYWFQLLFGCASGTLVIYSEVELTAVEFIFN